MAKEAEKKEVVAANSNKELASKISNAAAKKPDANDPRDDRTVALQKKEELEKLKADAEKAKLEIIKADADKAKAEAHKAKAEAAQAEAEKAEVARLAIVKAKQDKAKMEAL